MMRSVGRLGSLIVAMGCGTATSDAPKATPARASSDSVGSPDASHSSAGAEARIERVERGLIPEVRVAGESGGWWIEDRLRVHHTPGVSVAVIDDHRVVWAKGYGVADVVTGERLTDKTLMQAASVSKMLTAIAALKKVEAGEIPLGADVNQTLRSWQLPANAWTSATPVTLAHLLSHTGGTNVPSLVQDGRPPSTVELLEGKPPAVTPPVRVDLAPGTTFRYSGGGTTIVQQMLEDVEHRPFPEIMSDVVLAPLGLSHSFFGMPSKSERWPSIAAGHDFDGTALDGSFGVWTGAAGSGLWSTPTDLARVLIEIQLGLEGRSTFISKEMASRMTTAVAPTFGDTISTTLGAFVETHGNGVYFGHDGHGIGFMTVARASTIDGKGAVVMANGQASAPLVLEILRSIAAEYAWDGWVMPPIEQARVDAAQLAALSGRYGGGAHESTLVAVRGDHLEARQPFRDPLELLPLSPDEFVSRADGVRFTFTVDANGLRTCAQSSPPWPPSSGTIATTRLPDDAPLEPLQLLEVGRFEDALAASKKLLQADPKDARVGESRLGRLGEDLLYRQLDPERAVLVLQLSFALHRQSPMACVNLAEALTRAGRRGEAVPLMAQAKTLFARDTAMGELARTFFLWKLARLRALVP